MTEKKPADFTKPFPNVLAPSPTHKHSNMFQLELLELEPTVQNEYMLTSSNAERVNTHTEHICASVSPQQQQSRPPSIPIVHRSERQPGQNIYNSINQPIIIELRYRLDLCVWFANQTVYMHEVFVRDPG